MKLIRLLTVRISALILAAICVCFSAGCSLIKKTEQPQKESINIAVDKLSGAFNPIYAVTAGDRTVASLLYSRLRNYDSAVNPVNNLGSISFEYAENDLIKYTVTVKKNLYFSNGAALTIDDVIFTYYFLADPSYDGVYSDWHKNDIVGLKEYYSDSKVKTITGIKRVDDHTCTVWFSSKNINSADELNVYVLPKSLYGDYSKGKAALVRDMDKGFVGCSSYAFSAYDGKNATLVSSPYALTQPEFDEITLTDTGMTGGDLVKYVSNGKADIAATPATVSALSNISGANIKTAFFDCDGYFSIFYSAKLLSPQYRRALIGLCDFGDVLTEYYGNYCTRNYLPMNHKCGEYPSEVSQPVYSSAEWTSFLVSGEQFQKTITAGFTGDENSIEKAVLDKYIKILAEKGVSLKVKRFESEQKMKSEMKKSKIALCIKYNKAGYNGDKYSLFNAGGDDNFVGINDENLNTVTERLHTATGFADLKTITLNLMSEVMKNAVEYPVCQTQNAVVYNSGKITAESDILKSVAAAAENS
ncbi:MAG: hypothetical protein K6B52_01230 [Clostridiales bacterium]|nr:hypothetical protein [Clostridiales bacterium]